MARPQSGTPCPTLCEKCVSSSTYPPNHVTLKIQETERLLFGFPVIYLVAVKQTPPLVNFDSHYF